MKRSRSLGLSRTLAANATARMCIALAVATAVTAVAWGQQRLGFNAQRGAPQVRNVRYDGRFTFARIRFETAPGGYYYRGLPAWAHGYGFGIEGDDEVAGRNLMRILKEITYVQPRTQESEVFALDDSAVMMYPVAYMAEPDYWVMNDREAAGLRTYLKKGGFLIFDDFRDDFRNGNQGWANFESNMRRVLPDAQFVDLDPSAPIFHSFYDIDSFGIIPQYYDQGAPILRGVYEDNDPAKRLLMVINFNTDVSNFWEYSANGFMPVALSNEAYKLGVNYVMYGMTH